MTTLPLTLRPALPRSLYLETTSRCNSLCETCILTFGGREPQKDLGWDEFRHVVDQFPVLERVLLHGIGEPLLNRDLPRMIEHLKGRGATVLFNSNAITLGPRLRSALIDTGLDELRVSLDATTAATYARIRGVDALDKVIANLEGLARGEAARRQRAPTGHALVHRPQGQHRGDPRADSAGGARLGGRDQPPAPRLQRPRPGDGGAVAVRPRQGAGGGVLRLTEAAAAEAGIAFTASGAVAPEVSLTPTHDDRPWSACRRPFSLVYVTVHGNVLPCCIAPFITQHYDGIVLGNLFRQSLEELWWGEPYLRFRSAIQTETPPEPCRGCGVKWSL